MAKKPPFKQTANSSTQKDLVIVMVLSLALGLGGGYFIGTTQDESSDDTATPSQIAMPHSHGSTTYEVPADTAPKIELVVAEDAKSGYNIQLITTDFTFTPGNVNKANVMNEGHAHVYVDGQKIARAYGSYLHYDGTIEGTKTFSAELNANDHSVYTVDGKPIRAEIQVTHDSNAADHDDMHSHSDQ